MTTIDHIRGYKNPIAYKISGVYSGIFIYFGVTLPFWALWLATIGMSPEEIGILIALPAFLKVVASPFIAQLCDKWGMIRRPMLLLMTVSILFFSGYFIFSEFYQIVLVTILFSMAFTGFSPLLESYTVRACDKYKLQYGRLRSVGSIVFVITSIFIGKYLDHFGYDNFLYFCMAAFVITFISAFLLPQEKKKVVPDNSEPSDVISPLKFLLTNQQFVMFLVVFSLIQMSHGFIYAMGSYYWVSQGIDNATIGALWGVGVISEILIFIFAGKIISLFRPMYVFAFIGIFGVIRWSVLAVSLSVPLLFVMQTLHGLTYGAAHLVAMYFLSTRVPDKYFTTAQSLYSSVPMGLALGLVLLAAGPLYNMFGGRAYFFMAGLCVIVLFVARYVRKIDIDGSLLK